MNWFKVVIFDGEFFVFVLTLRRRQEQGHSGVVGSEAVSLGKWIPTFRKIALTTYTCGLGSPARRQHSHSERQVPP
jgi:hypothetical protein